ncbi:hypothetical protein MUK72_20105 (plasmid) [Halococcus dombrowskii]|uniref:Uncharacterized protein n=1 Tax=Halococcus dombrowskii TaxID=179637 RepID=A0AAV3SL90_HALDO|nr:hypothetical protein [Halococcus dombrowskii]UOO97582.1 hypothetical protein MUK72_20105 [Halococcus dombrowskii]
MSSETTDKHIRVPARVHDRVKALKRDDETMGEAVDRLIGGYTLLDFTTETESIDDEAERAELKEAYDEYTGELEQTMIPDDT